MVTQREQWREIPGTDGMYEVSDLGRVRSKVRRGGTLKVITWWGWPAVRLIINGKQRVRRISQLMAEASIEPRKLTTCHNGHSLTTANLYEHEDKIKCRACVLDQVTAYRRERRTVRPAALV